MDMLLVFLDLTRLFCF